MKRKEIRLYSELKCVINAYYNIDLQSYPKETELFCGLKDLTISCKRITGFKEKALSIRIGLIFIEIKSEATTDG